MKIFSESAKISGPRKGQSLTSSNAELRITQGDSCCKAIDKAFRDQYNRTGISQMKEVDICTRPKKHAVETRRIPQKKSSARANISLVSLLAAVFMPLIAWLAQHRTLQGSHE